MDESIGGAKPKRKIRNYLLDRRFQLKYTLLLSLTSAILMGVMAMLLYLQMKDSEGRLSEEMERAHDGIAAEMEAASDMVRREMDISKQQLIAWRVPCVAPVCPECACADRDIVTESSGAVCDVEMCEPLCRRLGIRVPGASGRWRPQAPPASAPADPASSGGPGGGAGGPAAGPPPGAGAIDSPGTSENEPPIGLGADRADRPVGAVAPAGDEAKAESERQQRLIDEIKQEVNAETEARAKAMAEETDRRLATLDRDTQSRLWDLRDANRRGLIFILGATVAIFVALLLAGIVVTHKIAGPIYKMKLLMGRIDGDNLHLGGRLRRGDELKDLFQELAAMLERLRAHQGAEVATLRGLIERIRSADADDRRAAAIAALEEFERRMADAIDPKKGESAP